MENKDKRCYTLIDNYIFLYNLGDSGEFLVLPTYPDSIADSMSASFNTTTALSRSAPVFTYSNSGPRTVQVTLNLHREMLDLVNVGVSTMKVQIGDDYMDTLIKKLQAIAVPKYVASSKSVQPPMVAMRFGSEIFIKGVATSGISVTYSKPLIEDNKYSQVSIGFSVSEVDPYDASTVASEGSFRGITSTFRSWGYMRLPSRAV